MADDYQFDDLDPAATALDSSVTPAAAPKTEGFAPRPVQSEGVSQSRGAGQGGGSYASELFSKKIEAKFRTFYIDLKESSNGKFVKISEKSHGRKSTIMMDGEDLQVFIEALKEVQEKL